MDIREITDGKFILEHFLVSYVHHTSKIIDRKGILRAFFNKKEAISRGRCRRILILSCENESPFSVTFGDIIVREPTIRLIASLFPAASIRVVLNREHYFKNILNNIRNVSYYSPQKHGFNKIKGKHLGKSERNTFSINDVVSFVPDMIIDLSSRDGFLLLIDILVKMYHLNKMPFVVFANPRTSYFFSQSPKRLIKNDSPSVVTDLKAHQIFLYMICNQLGISSIKIGAQSWFPKIEISSPIKKDAKEWLKKMGINKDDKAVFLVDKALEEEKMFRVKTKTGYKNAFFDIAQFFHRKGFKVILHRFYDSFEKRNKLYNNMPSFCFISRHHTKFLGGLLANSIIKGVIGVDTGVMHLASAVVPQKKKITIFTNREQDPVCWYAPASDAVFFFKKMLVSGNNFNAQKLKQLTNTTALSSVPNIFFEYVSRGL